MPRWADKLIFARLNSDDNTEALAATIVAANQSDDGDALVAAMSALFALGTVIIDRQFSQLHAARTDRQEGGAQRIQDIIPPGQNPPSDQ